MTTAIKGTYQDMLLADVKSKKGCVTPKETVAAVCLHEILADLVEEKKKWERSWRCRVLTVRQMKRFARMCAYVLEIKQFLEEEQNA